MPVIHMTDATLRALAKAPPKTGVQLDYYDDPAAGGVRGQFLRGTLTFYVTSLVIVGWMTVIAIAVLSVLMK